MTLRTIAEVYTARAKCLACGQPLWTTDSVSPVQCSCRKALLRPDGTGRGIEPLTDVEQEAAVRTDLTATRDDTVILIPSGA